MDDEVTVICWMKLGVYIDFLVRILEIGDVLSNGHRGDNTSMKTYCRIYFKNGLDE